MKFSMDGRRIIIGVLYLSVKLVICKGRDAYGCTAPDSFRCVNYQKWPEYYCSQKWVKKNCKKMCGGCSEENQTNEVVTGMAVKTTANQNKGCDVADNFRCTLYTSAKSYYCRQVWVLENCRYMCGSCGAERESGEHLTLDKENEILLTVDTTEKRSGASEKNEIEQNNNTSVIAADNWLKSDDGASGTEEEDVLLIKNRSAFETKKSSQVVKKKNMSKKTEHKKKTSLTNTKISIKRNNIIMMLARAFGLLEYKIKATKLGKIVNDQVRQDSRFLNANLNIRKGNRKVNPPNEGKLTKDKMLNISSTRIKNGIPKVNEHTKDRYQKKKKSDRGKVKKCITNKNKQRKVIPLEKLGIGKLTFGGNTDTEKIDKQMLKGGKDDFITGEKVLKSIAKVKRPGNETMEREMKMNDYRYISEDKFTKITVTDNSLKTDSCPFDQLEENMHLSNADDTLINMEKRRGEVKVKLSDDSEDKKGKMLSSKMKREREMIKLKLEKVIANKRMWNGQELKMELPPECKKLDNFRCFLLQKAKTGLCDFSWFYENCKYMCRLCDLKLLDTGTYDNPLKIK